MSQPLISVVIPAYNTEALIASTLGSVLAQDYENIEIIVVNDASTDRTGGVAKEVLAAGTRPYKVIDHEINRGVSAARNTGMVTASGEYITFIDSDDTVDADYVSTMYKAVSGDAGMAVCGYKEDYLADGRIARHPLDTLGGADVSVEFAERIIRGNIDVYYGASLYRMDLLVKNGIEFTEGCEFAEDAEFFIEAISVSDKTAFLSGCYYTYRIHDKMGSIAGHITHEYNVKRYTDLIQARIRAGRYVIQHSKSRRLIDAAKYELLPRYYLKMFTMHAWRGDKEAFFADLRSDEIRDTITASRKSFFKSPDVFLKYLWLRTLPNMYFEHRRRHVYRYRG